MNSQPPQIPSLSIVVPTFREAENLPLLIPQLAQVLGSRGWIWEVIIVDDNSCDATPQILETLSRSFPQLRYTIRTHDRGLSSAVLAGISLSRYENIVVMDADLSHPPEAVPLLVEKLLRDEADFVLGSRYVTGGKTEDWTWFRWLNSLIATALSKPFIGATRDPMSGFMAVRRATLAQADPLNPIGYKIGLELMVKCHVKRIVEVPITFRNRAHGESKLTLTEQFRYLEHLSRLYDYQYPKGSARTKFLIASGCGALACLAALLGLERFADVTFPLSMAGGLLAMVLVTLLFFLRYVHTQRDFLIMRHPYSEFLYISLAEVLVGWFFAVSTGDTATPSLFKASVGIAAVLVVRYMLRKVFLHDLRGIHGEPKPASTLRLTFSAAPSPPSIASA